MKMETLQQRRDELERKEQQLKESLLKFDKFLKVHMIFSSVSKESQVLLLPPFFPPSFSPSPSGWYCCYKHLIVGK